LEGTLKLNDVFAGIGKPFFYFPKLAAVLGGANPSILFCSIVWRDADRHGDEIVKSLAELREQTGLTDKEIRVARQKLSHIGVVTSRYARLEHRLYFTVIFDCLESLLSSEHEPNGQMDHLPLRADGDMPLQASGTNPKGQVDLLVLENKSEKKEEKASALPPWLPLEAWKGFKEMRNKSRCPMTELAEQLAVKELDKLRAQGQSPEEVLNQSTLMGWRGLFPVHGNRDGSSGGREDKRQSFAERRDAKNKEVLAKAFGKPDRTGPPAQRSDP
jgi:hypothetical protein